MHHSLGRSFSRQCTMDQIVPGTGVKGPEVFLVSLQAPTVPYGQEVLMNS